MRQHLETVSTVAIALSALAIAATVVHREVRRTAPPALQAAGPPQFVPEWRSLIEDGIRIGDSTAPVTIIEFADLECPFCRRFHASYNELAKQMGKKVSLIFVHWPIEGHRFARAGSRATECARAQGKFSEYLDLTFSKQDSLGLKSWNSYAREAGVPDTVRFANCNARTEPLEMVDRGLAAGNRIQVHGTPTVLINGWRYAVTPYDSLAAEVSRIASRKLPN